MLQLNDTQKIGLLLTVFGSVFLFLGVVLLFDKGLLAIGNILFVCGIGCLIGPQRTFRFFFQQHRVKASLAFFGGMTVVLLGWPIVGMVIEFFGFYLLFKGFLPFIISSLRQLPIIGSILRTPPLGRMLDKLEGSRSNV
ncbi:vesicle transport protein GOT1B-like isoform X1 [Artemia franciscana]|uniref:Vesicle transport protein GOT1B n=1 Tax=Artemia franciscana TaxID=6661 RepID=A0AA88HKN1_ARTSF|nr:hypothetical protein QYM36_011613 [Artemia franciscana]